MLQVTSVCPAQASDPENCVKRFAFVVVLVEDVHVVKCIILVVCDVL